MSMDHRHTLTITPGILSLPGITPASKAEAEKWLLDDHINNHCFFNQRGLHNHLSHHILAAFDLGAPPVLIKAAREYKQKMQKPIDWQHGDTVPNVIDKDNWQQFFGNFGAYPVYLEFFDTEIQAKGIDRVVIEYVLSPDAHKVKMLSRLVAGAAHPLIQLGYGIEFSSGPIVAQGLAQACSHREFTLAEPMYADIDQDPPATPSKPVNPNGRYSAGGGPSLLEIMKDIDSNDILKPVPYIGGEKIIEIMVMTLKSGKAAQEINKMVSKWHLPSTLNDDELRSKMEELVYLSILLTFSSGREGEKPRLDFFLMHAVTSALFLPTFFKVTHDPAHRIRLLRHIFGVIIGISITRGRPQIIPELAMSFSEYPQPKSRSKISLHIPGENHENHHVNPWPLIIQSILLAPDSHTLKTLRTLLFAERMYSLSLPGSMIGAYHRETGEEVFPGAGKVDGTLFVRCAGVLADTMGWVAEGETPAPDWDRSGLGWDEAWKRETVVNGVMED